MKPNDNDADRVGDWVNISKEQWLLYAVLSGMLFVLMGLLGTVWILGIADFGLAIDDLGVRARAAGPIGAFLLAIVTFFTIGWRGKVQEDQAIEQRRANESTDENNLANLLQKGAELLGDKDESKVAAGIACLEAVVTAKNRRFGTQAMNLLAKYIELHHPINHRQHLCAVAIAAIEEGYGNSCKGTSPISFNGKILEKPYWKVILGGQSVTYNGGYFYSVAQNCDKISEWHKFGGTIFKNVQIQKLANNFANCNFTNCEFQQCDVYALSQNYFGKCDFSGTIFGGFMLKYTKSNIKDFVSKSYYFTDNPPTCENENLLRFLLQSMEAKDPSQRLPI